MHAPTAQHTLTLIIVLMSVELGECSAASTMLNCSPLRLRSFEKDLKRNLFKVDSVPVFFFLPPQAQGREIQVIYNHEVLIGVERRLKRNMQPGLWKETEGGPCY